LDRVANAFAGDKTETAERPPIRGRRQDEQRMGPGFAFASNAFEIEGPFEPVLSLHRWIVADNSAANPSAGFKQAATKQTGYTFQFTFLT
jgi:hypothetical protein